MHFHVFGVPPYAQMSDLRILTPVSSQNFIGIRISGLRADRKAGLKVRFGVLQRLGPIVLDYLAASLAPQPSLNSQGLSGGLGGAGRRWNAEPSPSELRTSRSPASDTVRDRGFSRPALGAVVFVFI